MVWKLQKRTQSKVIQIFHGKGWTVINREKFLKEIPACLGSASSSSWNSSFFGRLGSPGHQHWGKKINMLIYKIQYFKYLSLTKKKMIFLWYFIYSLNVFLFSTVSLELFTAGILFVPLISNSSFLNEFFHQWTLNLNDLNSGTPAAHPKRPKKGNFWGGKCCR